MCEFDHNLEKFDQFDKSTFDNKWPFGYCGPGITRIQFLPPEITPLTNLAEVMVEGSAL